MLLSKKINFLLFFCFLCSSVGIAQNSPGSVEFIKQFKSIQDQLPRETIYLHTDRDWYYLNERIWFSGYILAGGFLQPSEISEVLYVELIKPDGEIIARDMVKITDGKAAGSLRLDHPKGENGIYELKAYTKWSTNFGPSYLFSKRISVLSQDQNNDFDSEISNNEIDLQFFPESGSLVAGISNPLAFKAIGTDGLGEHVSGTIEDHENNIIHSFESQHLGMGLIDEFTPEPGKRYKAVVEGREFSLPEVNTSGAIFNITSDGDFYRLTFNSSDEFKNKPLMLFAHVRGVIFHASKLQITSKLSREIIPKNTFPTGIIHFTLLNDDGSILAERLAFSKNDVDQIQVTTDFNQDQFERRQRVQLSLDLADANSEPVNGKASISIYDDNIIEYNSDQLNIASHLLLGTEIKGYIENPGFYFSNNEKSDQYLDLLLLTQGWRAFEMEKEKLDEQLESFVPPEKGIDVSGKVSTLLTERPLEESVVFFSLGSDDDAQIITTDEDGRFRVEGLNFTGLKTAEVKANKKDGSDRVWVEMEDQFIDLPQKRSRVLQDPIHTFQRAGTPSENAEEILKERTQMAISNAEEYVDAQLKGDLGEFTVTARATNNNQFNQDISSVTSTAGMSSRIDMEHNPGIYEYSSLEQILAQQPGVRYNYGTKEISLRTGFTTISTPPSPLIMVDGVDTPFQDILFLSPNNIKSITINRSAIDNAIFGSRGAGGSIVIETKSGIIKNESSLETSTVQGFQTPTDFYIPKYGVNIPSDNNQLDNRITLHWDSDLEINQENTDVVFWTNDVPSTYRIVLEGITATGMPFYKTSTFTVNE